VWFHLSKHTCLGHCRIGDIDVLTQRNRMMLEFIAKRTKIIQSWHLVISPQQLNHWFHDKEAFTNARMRNQKVDIVN